MPATRTKLSLAFEIGGVLRGILSGDLVIESDDAQQPDTDGDGFGEVRAPLLGWSL